MYEFIAVLWQRMLLIALAHCAVRSHLSAIDLTFSFRFPSPSVLECVGVILCFFLCFGIVIPKALAIRWFDDFLLPLNYGQYLYLSVRELLHPCPRQA